MAKNRNGGFGPKPLNERARFMQYVQIAGGDACWTWTGGLFRTGYGKFGKRFGRGDYRNRDAHRVMWELVNGPIPDSKTFVCHACDNRPCVRPSHLFLGTVLDNARDAIAKGRYRRGDQWPHEKHDIAGEKNPRAKLTREMVHEIRRRIQSGEPQTAIARDFGVVPQTIQAIRSGRNWRCA